MKCSICNQKGHNKRFCKNILTPPLSSPEIKAIANINIIPPTKINKTDNYSPILQKALDSNNINIIRLTEKCGDICIKTELDTISKQISKTWAPFKATVVSVIAKMLYPDWDTRNHQTQIGGKYSLRGIDKCYVSNFLYKKGLYDTSTEFALTRSFEKAEPFNKKYSGMISPKECKTAFLNIVEIINTKVDINDLLDDILIYLMTFLKNRLETITTLKNSVVVFSKDINMIDITKLLDEINKIGSGSSVIPVIIAHTLLSVIQPHLWVKLSMNPLKEHTAPDNHTKSYGDIEGIDDNFKPKIAIEVKHKISINDSIIETFNNKIKNEDIPLKFIITTAKIERKVVQNNICVDTLNGFVISHLQQTLFHERTICLIFIEELRRRILSYRNVSVSIKEFIINLLTSLLVSSSL